MQGKDVITLCHFLIDALNVVSNFSMALQKRNTCVYEVHQQLQVTIINLQKLQDYGDEFLSTIADYYEEFLAAQGIEISMAELEWINLTHLLYENQTVHTMDWRNINNLYFDQCRNVLQLFDLILSLPAATSECERGFSQMTIMKNKYRNKLKSTTMTMLMTISLHFSEIPDYYRSEAIHYWNQNGSRRPEFLIRKRTFADKISSELQLQTAEQAEGDLVEVIKVDEKDQPDRPERSDSDYESDFSDLFEL